VQKGTAMAKRKIASARDTRSVQSARRNRKQIWIPKEADPKKGTS
jgi:hypothetical protein